MRVTAEDGFPCTLATGALPGGGICHSVSLSPGIGSTSCDLVVPPQAVEAVFVVGLFWGLLIGCIFGLALRRRRNRLNFDLSCEPQR